MPPRLRVTIRRRYGEVTFEAETPEELTKLLIEHIEAIDRAVKDSMRYEAEAGVEAELEGVVAYREERPIITVPKDRLSVKEAISLLLYACGEQEMRPSEINQQLMESGIVSAGYPARLSEMIREGLLFKGEVGYKLTEYGKMVVKDLLKRIREAEKIG